MIKTLKNIAILLLFTTGYGATALQAHGKMHGVMIGKESVPPGIVFIFKAGGKDTVLPASKHLSKEETDVHIGVRAN